MTDRVEQRVSKCFEAMKVERARFQELERCIRTLTMTAAQIGGNEGEWLARTAEDIIAGYRS